MISAIGFKIPQPIHICFICLICIDSKCHYKFIVYIYYNEVYSVICVWDFM